MPLPLERRLERIFNAAKNEQNKEPQQEEFWPKLTGAAAMLNHQDNTEWLWKDAIPQGSASMLAGQPRAGKSTLAFNLALAMSRGVEFLRRITNKCTTAYISVDSSITEMKVIADAVGLRPTDNMMFHCGQVPERQIDWLFDVIKQGQIKFAVVDTFQRFLRIEELKDSSEVTRILDPINRQAEAVGCALFWLHHSGKSKEMISNATSALGSIAIKGMSPYYFEISRVDDARIFRSDLRNGQNFDGTYLKIDRVTGWTVMAGTSFDAMVEAAVKRIVEFLGHETEPVTEKAMLDCVELRRQLLVRALRRMVKRGDVDRMGYGGRKDPFRYMLAPQLMPAEQKQE